MYQTPIPKSSTLFSINNGLELIFLLEINKLIKCSCSIVFKNILILFKLTKNFIN